MRALLAAALAFAVALAPALLRADPERSLRIERLTLRIAAAPDDARLYLDRAAEWRLARDFERAFADLERARTLAPDLPGLALATGQLWLDAGRPERARAALEPWLVRAPRDAQARVIRARACAALGDRGAAITDLDVALEALERPTPELYLERAALQRAAGGAGLDAALAGLDEGALRLGPVYTLVEAAIEIEVERESFGAALARSTRLPDALLRLPEWQARRADWLRASGRAQEARRAYTGALAALRAGQGRRSAEASAALERRIVASLAEVPAAAGSAPELRSR